MATSLEQEDTSSDAAMSGGAPAAGRFGSRASWLAATCAISMLAYGGGWLLAQLGLGARLLKVQAIDVTGLGRTSREDVLQAAGLAMQQPILGIPLQARAAALEALPWVRAAAIRRQLPFRIGVTVSEHTAQLAVMLSELWLVNEDGEPFKRFHASDQLVLPMVTGLVAQPPSESPFAAQTALKSDLRAAIALHDELTRIRDDLFAVEELHHDPDLGWSVVLLLGRAQGQVRGERAGVTVHLGLQPQERLAAMVAALAELADRRLTPTTIWAANRHQAGRIQVALAEPLATAATALPVPARRKRG